MRTVSDEAVEHILTTEVTSWQQVADERFPDSRDVANETKAGVTGSRHGDRTTVRARKR